MIITQRNICHQCERSLDLPFLEFRYQSFLVQHDISPDGDNTIQARSNQN